jgi:hypothetical protein
MAVNVNDNIRKLSPARRKKVEGGRAAELIAGGDDAAGTPEGTQTQTGAHGPDTGDYAGQREPAGEAQTFFSQHSAGQWKPWEGICRWSRSFPTGSPSSCAVYPRRSRCRGAEQAGLPLGNPHRPSVTRTGQCTRNNRIRNAAPGG